MEMVENTKMASGGKMEANGKTAGIRPPSKMHKESMKNFVENDEKA